MSPDPKPAADTETSTAALIRRVDRLRDESTEVAEEALRRMTRRRGTELCEDLDTWRTRLRYLVSALVQAQQRGHPETFARQVTWARQSALARGTTPGEFERGLNALRECAEEVLGPYRWLLAAPFASLDTV